jgi:hypothetical protein
MAFNFFSPKPGRFGIATTLLVGRCQTTMANGVTYQFGSHPAKCLISRAVVSALTVPVSNAGTITGVLQKYDASANAAVTLTGNVNLEALTAKEGTAVSLLTTLTDAQKTLDTGDTLQFVITSGTVDTQPVDLMVNTELLVLE